METEVHAGPIWHLTLLGDVRITGPDGPCEVPANRALPLLALLACEPAAHQRDTIAGRLYPSLDQRTARRRISQALWLLDRALPGLPLVRDHGRLQLDPALRTLDVETLRAGAASTDPDERRTALAAYRGPLLPGVHDHYVEQERQALQGLYVTLARRVHADLVDAGRDDEAVALLHDVLEREPLDEAVLRTLMRAEANRGRRAAALHLHRRFAEDAARVGLELEPATERLAEQIAHARRRATDWVAQARRPAPRPTDEVDDALLRGALDSAEQLLRARGQAHPFLLRHARLARGRHDLGRARHLAEEALLEAHRQHDAAGHLEALRELGVITGLAGESASALACLNRALTQAGRDTPPAVLAELWIAHGDELARQGRLRDALRALDEGLAVTTERRLGTHEALARQALGRTLSLSGYLDQAADAQHRALARWRELNAQRRQAEGLGELAHTQMKLGQTVAAVRSAEAALATHTELDDALGVARSQWHLARALLGLGDRHTERSLELVEAALQTAHAYEDRFLEAEAANLRGCLLLASARSAEAFESLERAHRLHLERGELGELPAIQALQGFALLELERVSEARDRARQALLALMTGCGDNDLAPVVHHAVAATEEGTGQAAADVRRHLRTAYGWLCDIGRAQAGQAPLEEFLRRGPLTRALVSDAQRRGLAEPRPETNGGRTAEGELRYSQGAVASRRATVKRLVRARRDAGESVQVEDIAEAVGVSPRTVRRDLAALERTASRPG